MLAQKINPEKEKWKSSPLLLEREQDKTQSKNEFINIKKPSRENTNIGIHGKVLPQYL